MIRLLVVDDEEDIRKETVDYFEELGYEALEARDGMHAWQLFKEHSFDVIISDLMMPKSRGDELVNCIREEDKNVVIVVIAGTYVKTQIAGADEVLFKPFGLDKLRAAVETLLEQRRGGNSAREVTDLPS